MGERLKKEGTGPVEGNAETEAFQHGGGDHGAAGDAAARRMAHKGHAQDLGVFNHENPPGKALGGKNFVVPPGGSITFEIGGNQIYNVVDLIAAPHGAVAIERKLVHAMNPGQLGDSNVYRYTLTMKEGAGHKATVTSEPSYQSRSDPGWAFHFTMQSEMA